MLARQCYISTGGIYTIVAFCLFFTGGVVGCFTSEPTPILCREHKHESDEESNEESSDSSDEEEGFESANEEGKEEWFHRSNLDTVAARMHSYTEATSSLRKAYTVWRISIAAFPYD